MSDLILQTHDLRYSFGGLTATDEVSLEIQRGARHALIGPNGAGKTTLLNLLTGVLIPSRGRIILDNSDVTTLSVHRRAKLGLIRTFQISQLFPTFTPLQTLALTINVRTRGARGFWRPMLRDAMVVDECAQLLAMFRLEDVAGQATAYLPYGKRRLLEIAMAFALKPRVLLLDEPVAGVPAAERQEILDSVASLPADVSILLIEHDMDLVFSFATQITVLANGAILTHGTPDEIQHNPKVQEVYLGKTPVHRGNHG